MAKASRVQPNDVYSCSGCGQTLTFDARGFVPKAQLDGCESKCEWTLTARDGIPTDTARATPELPGA